METEMDMSSSSGGGPAGSRWTPTKDQIELLENLYRQGVRTPSAEQIQHITSKLRAFGHIEGKNVFYWFQNHKARQRQKQKQENVALFNRFMLHQNQPPPPHFPTNNYLNVSCHGSFYMPHPPPTELGFRPKYQKLLIPGCYNNKKRPLQHDTFNDTNLYTKPCNVPVLEPMIYQDQNLSMQNNVKEKVFFDRDQETLDLFPLHPTGNLQERRASMSIPSTSNSLSAYSHSNYSNGSGNFGHDQPLIDFFCMDGQCKSS